MKNLQKLISIFYLSISILILLYIYYRSEIFWNGLKPEYYFKYYILSFSLVLFSLFSFLLSERIKINLSILLVSLVFSFYLIEAYLVFFKKNIDLNKIIKSYEKNTGKKYDTRSKFEVYQNLKQYDSNIVVNIPPNDVFENKDFEFFYVSGISNSKTIHCNENGYFSIYKSDRYGFNNPDKEWNKEIIDFLLVGDSFTHGACVNRPNDIASNLRKIKQNNNGVLNLGHTGHGPLFQYVTLREYLLNKNVKNILWLYYEGNDNSDLNNELNNPILQEYLKNKQYTQNLISIQNKIDSLLKRRIQQQIQHQKFLNYSKLIKLYSIRAYFFDKNFVKEKNKFTHLKKPKLQSQFTEILDLANNLAKENESKLYFVYLPELARYKYLNYDNSNYKEIIKVVKSLKISIIDIHLNVFKNQKDPLTMFPFSSLGHYTPEGYKLVAESIFNHIDG